MEGHVLLAKIKSVCTCARIASIPSRVFSILTQGRKQASFPGRVFSILTLGIYCMGVSARSPESGEFVHLSKTFVNLYRKLVCLLDYSVLLFFGFRGLSLYHDKFIPQILISHAACKLCRKAAIPRNP